MEPRQGRVKTARQELPGRLVRIFQVPPGTAEVTMAGIMSYHTRTSLLVHCVFSTKNRLPSIPAELQPRLWSYIGGIVRTNSMKALAVGGTRDHIHLLLSLPPTMAVGKALQLIKAGSSKWIHEQVGARFAWQVGYGAFTMGVSQVPATIHYILNQEKHHAKKSFAQEWKMFMDPHGLELEEDLSRP